MPRPKIPGLVLSPEDEAAVRKWRRAVCAFYGCIGLILIAAWGVHRLVNDSHKDTASFTRVPAPPAASIVPASARR
jgi:flagellar biogenesis protein FliO